MKHDVLLNIKSQFVPQIKHTEPQLQSPAGECYVGSVVFTAVTIKNAIFWDIKTQFLPHRKHITSPLQRPAI
jgi:hypothetical protein